MPLVTVHLVCRLDGRLVLGFSSFAFAGVAPRVRLLGAPLVLLHVLSVQRRSVSVLSALLHRVEVERILVLRRAFNVLEQRLILQIPLNFAEVFSLMAMAHALIVFLALVLARRHLLCRALHVMAARPCTHARVDARLVSLFALRCSRLGTHGFLRATMVRDPFLIAARSSVLHHNLACYGLSWHVKHHLTVI